MSKYDHISERLNDVWMNGFQEDNYGSCQEEGFAAALILTDSIQGIIIENDQGFIDYEVFNGDEEAQRRWKEMVGTWQNRYKPEYEYLGAGS